MMSETHESIESLIKSRLAELEQEKQRLLKELESGATPAVSIEKYGTPASPTLLTTSEERIALFIRLFRCREDVFPKYWENHSKGTKGYSPACQVEWVRGVCDKPKVKCSECPNRVFVPLDKSVIRDHLEGKITIGTYAIREDDTCTFLAADFDKEHWKNDILAYKKAAENIGVEVSIERSRSGNGGHAWIFFQAPLSARLARQLGTLILIRAIAQRHTIGFDSYDRFFPHQDTLPKGGFGNLIALPLQRIPRKSGNSVFIDEDFNAYPDQWEYLSKVKLLSTDEITAILYKNIPIKSDISKSNQGDPIILEAEASIDASDEKIKNIYPGIIRISISEYVEICIEGLPSCLIAAFKRKATFANPRFFELQRMRFSTWKTPRYICCAELSEDGNWMRLPRGLFFQCQEIVKTAGAQIVISDNRKNYSKFQARFTGKLLPAQKRALRDLLNTESGVLVAPPGAGKTVIGCAFIAKRKLPTLVLVHRKQLADQWKEQLHRFTNIIKKQIGIYDTKGVKRKGIVDIGMLQTLSRENISDRIINEYGQIIIDECHHVPAASFEPVLKRISTRHVVGLTATPYRKDGLEKIITMQCGPILHTMMESIEQMQIKRRVIVRETSFRMPGESGQQPLHEIWQALVNDKDRLRLVATDVASALEEGRFPLVLSDRIDHLESLMKEVLSIPCKKEINGFLITSDMGKRARSQMIEQARQLRKSGSAAFLLST